MISNKEPITNKRKIRTWLELFVFFCFILVVGDGWNGVIIRIPIILLTFGILIGMKEFFEKQFDGWRIDDDSITLIRINLFGKKEEQRLKFNKIDYILYVRPAAKRPFAFKFKSENKTYWLEPTIDIYGFSETLKYLKEQGIKIEFLEKDHEVELYLDGRIDSIPLTNDMIIRNKNNKSIP